MQKNKLAHTDKMKASFEKNRLAEEKILEKALKRYG